MQPLQGRSRQHRQWPQDTAQGRGHPTASRPAGWHCGKC